MSEFVTRMNHLEVNSLLQSGKFERMRYRPGRVYNIKLHVKEWNENKVHCLVLVSCKKL